MKAHISDQRASTMIMGTKSPWPLLALFSLLALRALSQDLDLKDALDEITTERAGEKSVTKPPGRVTTTTKATAKPKPNPDSDGLDLMDALDPKNDIRPKDKKGGNDGEFTDSDLDDIDNYKPDKGKGGIRDSTDSDDNYGKPKYNKKKIGRHHLETQWSAQDTCAYSIHSHGSSSVPGVSRAGTVPETATIAGIASAVAMAFVGAVTSYISYQKKKLCFSMQREATVFIPVLILCSDFLPEKLDCAAILALYAIFIAVQWLFNCGGASRINRAETKKSAT
uniref:CD99 molecule-like 2 n=1 Tax=Scleropages formosus TaxID=113540 RepID=A0A8C9SWF7_SCLFO